MFRYVSLSILAAAALSAQEVHFNSNSPLSTAAPADLPPGMAANSPPISAQGSNSAAAGSFSQLMAQYQDEPAPLLGEVHVNTYVAPSGSYQIEIPVRMGLGGTVTDSEHLVTFEDAYTTHLSIANFRMDPTQRWESSVDTRKEYLIGFFEKYVLRNFRNTFDAPDHPEIHNVTVEDTARYLPTMLGGSFIAFIDIINGTNFASRIPIVASDPKPRIAKYGVMLFTHDGFIYVISSELAEKAIEGSAYNTPLAKEDIELRGRLLDTASQIQFLKAPPESDDDSNSSAP